MKEAFFYQKRDNGKIKCSLCPHACLIKEGARGLCGVRENDKGLLYSLVHGLAIVASVDPIEKKPLYHFLPKTHTYSIASVGCNLSCDFCQNWEISQSPKPDKKIEGVELPPEEVVDNALKKGCASISYTYTEPTIFFEYAYETAKIAHHKGLKNIFVSNGFINVDPIRIISKYLDAINIDLKGFSNDHYLRICGGRLSPILKAIEEYQKQGVFIEITTLIIPGHNDSEEMLSAIADFIAGIGTDIPWHISRFFPSYKMGNIPPTPIATIERAFEIGKEKGIKNIYKGNI